jgi:hypothetical protein
MSAAWGNADLFCSARAFPRLTQGGLGCAAKFASNHLVLCVASEDWDAYSTAAASLCRGEPSFGAAVDVRPLWAAIEGSTISRRAPTRVCGMHRSA